MPVSLHHRARGDIACGIRAVFTLPSTHRRNPHFIPHPDIQATVESLRPGDVLVLHGLAGVGKTQHAVQYAHEHQAQYAHVLWASAEREQVLRDALAALAELAELALPVQVDADSVEKIRALRSWLGTAENWLLILDSADSDKVARVIEQFLPPAHHGHVLITSCLTNWTSGFRSQPIHVWNDREAIAFLTQRLDEMSFSSEELGKLTQELGGLPLALEHAAAHMIETRTSLAQYLRLLATDRRTLLTRRYPGMTDYRASVALTWNIAIRRLSFLAKYLLRLAACFAPEPIPRRIFNYLIASAPNDYTHDFIELKYLSKVVARPQAIDLVLAELARYSLIFLSEETIRVHPLLQKVVRDSAQVQPWNWVYRLPRRFQGFEKEVWRACFWPKRAASLLATKGVLPGSVVVAIRDPAMKQYLPHIEAVLALFPEAMPLPLQCEQLKNAFKYHRERLTEYKRGCNALREALTNGLEGSSTLNEGIEWLFSNFDDLYQRIPDNYEHQLSYYLRAIANEGDTAGDRVESAYKILGWMTQAYSTDNTIAQQICELWYKHTQDYPAASPWQKARAGAELASVDRNRSREEIQSLLKDALAVFEQHGALKRYNGLFAIWHFALLADNSEDAALALRWLSEVISWARELLESGFPDAVRLTEQLVRLLREAERAEEALVHCEETLRIACRCDERIRRRLDFLYFQRGVLMEEKGHLLSAARSYARSFLLGRRYKTGPLSFQLKMLHNAGDMFRRAGYSETARSKLHQAAALLEELWVEEPGCAETLAALVGLALSRLEDKAEGEALLRRAVASRSQRSKRNDPDNGFLHLLLGTLFQEAERFSDAETQLRQALICFEEQVPADHETLLRILDRLVTSLEHLRRCDEALNLRQRFLVTLEKECGNQSWRLVPALVNEAHLLCLLNRGNEAAERFRRVIDLATEALGENHEVVRQFWHQLTELAQNGGTDCSK